MHFKRPTAVRPKAVLAGLRLLLTMACAFAAREAAASPREAPIPPASVTQPRTAAPAPATGAASEASPAASSAHLSAVDPFLAAMLGALPLSSGFYLTSAPRKGLVFTLSDAMLLAAIVNVRRDERKQPEDATAYYALLGAVNLADLALSLLQAKTDAATRLRIVPNPPDRPGFVLAWTF